jgi:hypothetical protein
MVHRLILEFLHTPQRGAGSRQSSSLCLLNVIGSNQPDWAAAGYILSDVRCLFSRDPLFHNILIERTCY